MRMTVTDHLVLLTCKNAGSLPHAFASSLDPGHAMLNDFNASNLTHPLSRASHRDSSHHDSTCTPREALIGLHEITSLRIYCPTLHHLVLRSHVGWIR